MYLCSQFDVCIQPPERLTPIESWHRHMPFACAILHMLKPAVLVELGTHRGDSYSAFCQAVVQQRLSTRCFAVDTWQGDAHAGEYGDEIYADLKQWHDPRYADFSSLLRMTFDQALEHFVDGSVDLLHIDGLHTYEAVRHDFESWLPKLSSRAVVLFHDTNVRYDDFAVWQLWAELAQQYPAFEFPFGFGLGVLAVGSEVPQAVLEFLAYAQQNPREVIDYFYRHGDAAEVLKKTREIERLRSHLEDIGSQLEHARGVVEQRDLSLTELSTTIEQLEQKLQAAVQHTNGMQEHFEQEREIWRAQHQEALAHCQQEQEAANQAWKAEQHTLQEQLSKKADLERQCVELDSEKAELEQQYLELKSGFEQLRSMVFAHQVEHMAQLRARHVERGLLQRQGQQLQMVLNSRLWRLRNRSMALVGLSHRLVEFSPLSLPALPPASQLLEGRERPAVTIIVPVYRGLETTQACLESILASDFVLDAELVVINDASPEPELVQWLNDNSSRFTLLHNESNQGFVRTVNRGMRLYPEQDVVLVNSDTLVVNDWLDRLQAAAYRAEHIGSVTPFSNNATICSFPRFCEDNPLPEGIELAELDQVFATANAGEMVDIPTAVGFCMYIRRACLQDAGLFDELRFGRGYGEENEFCMRSALHGWRHVLAGDVFVYHEGGVSFAETQNEHQKLGHAALLGLFPDYDWVVQQHIAADPAARLRFVAGLALMRASELPTVVMVSHGRGGGSERHLQELVIELEGTAQVCVLQPVGGRLRLQCRVAGAALPPLFFAVPEQHAELLDTLRQLHVQHVHFHHFIDVPEALLRLPAELECSYDITVHDYYLACPQVTLADEQGRYCGAPDEAGCNACLHKRPVAGVADIAQWRSLHAPLLAGAERIYVPCADTLQRISAYFPMIERWVHARHEQLADMPAPEGRAPRSGEPLRVLVLGALSVFKGADTLEQVATLLRARRAPVELHLLGYAYRTLETRPMTALQVHGAYSEGEVQERIAEIAPHVVWFPGSCPETWSYTLSVALMAGLPVIAPRIGAFPERLAGRPWSWLVGVDRTVDDWAVCLEQVHAALLAGEAPEPPAGQAVEAGFVYGRDYFADLPVSVLQGDRSSVLTNKEGQWAGLHARWQQLAGWQPEVVLLPQVRNPLVRRLLVRALQRGWLQPLLARIPAGVQVRLKRLLTTG